MWEVGPTFFLLCVEQMHPLALVECIKVIVWESRIAIHEINMVIVDVDSVRIVFHGSIADTCKQPSHDQRLYRCTMQDITPCSMGINGAKVGAPAVLWICFVVMVKTHVFALAWVAYVGVPHMGGHIGVGITGKQRDRFTADGLVKSFFPGEAAIF